MTTEGRFRIGICPGVYITFLRKLYPTRKKIDIQASRTFIKFGSLKTLQDHPIIKAKEKNLEFSLSTDDPGAFENTVEGEYMIAREIFELTENELHEITMSGLRARFQKQQRYPGTLKTTSC